MLSYLPGTTLAETKPHAPELLASLGRMLAEIDLALRDFAHPCAQRFLKWDLSRSNWARDYLGHIADPERRALAKKFLNLFEEEAVPRFPLLRRSVIYGDANDHNALVDPKTKRVVSVIDFGDMHEGFTVGEPAIAAAYAILGKDDPLAAAGSVLAGYHEILPLAEEEIAAFFALMAARLAVSVVNSAHRKSLVPDDPYVTASEAPAWGALERLAAIDSYTAKEYFRAAAGKVAPIAGKKSSDGSSADMKKDLSVEDSLVARKRLLGGNLSLSYEKPLKIVRGSMQYLYDEAGRAYLDVYNNVPLVGHSHPRVVRAIQEQVALLNTNTRYLHDNILRYAEQLTALLPDPLRVCYFVNSGTEANELALRLARTHTGREDVIVLEHAYHGHTSTLIDISPYKFGGPGGRGRKPWVHVAPIADDYRGAYRRGEAEIGKKYAAPVGEILQECKRKGSAWRLISRRRCRAWLGRLYFHRIIWRKFISMSGRKGRCALPTRCKWVSAAWARTFGIWDAGSGARHRGVWKADGECVSAGCGGDDARNCRFVREWDGIFQHVRRKSRGVRGGTGGARCAARREPSAERADGWHAVDSRFAGVASETPPHRRCARPSDFSRESTWSPTARLALPRRGRLRM